jgi:predicted outer membrane lipoprotein
LIGAAVLFLLVNLTLFPFVWGDRSIQDSISVASLYGAGSTPHGITGLEVSREVDMGGSTWLLEPMLILDGQLLFGKHEAPIWNPYNAYGSPLAADMQSQPFNPLAWVAMLIPGARGYDIFIMLRIYLAGLFAFLFLRRFLAFVPALAGGAAFMYTGYLWMYLTLPEVSVEMLVPLLLLVTENLVRAPTPRNTAWFALAYAWSVLGGMPEATLLAVAFGMIYAVTRVASTPELRARFRPIAIRVAVGGAIGFCIAALLLFPLAEYVPRSFNTHSVGDVVPGLETDPYAINYVGVYLTPLLNGPPWNNIFNGFSGHFGARGFFGTTVAFFALLATLVALRERVRGERGGIPTLLFSAVAVSLLSKRFGVWFINWIGYLPGFKFVGFTKYEEAVLACCFAVLAAVGVDRMMRRRVAPWEILAAASAFTAFFTIEAGIEKPAYLALTANQHFYIWGLAGSLVALGLSAVVVLLVQRGRIATFAGGIIVAAGIVVEMNAAYIVPMFYVVTHPPSQTLSTFEQDPPYVKFLQAHVGNDRFFGEDDLLFPDWNAPYGLADPRSLDAFYDQRFLPFVQQFWTDHRNEDLDNRFTAAVPSDFTSGLHLRFLQLSSITYVASTHPIGGSILNDMLNDNAALAGAAFRAGDFDIAGVRKPGLFVHPPQPYVHTTEIVPADASYLDFSYGMLPDVWNGPTTCGDGVTFTVTAGPAGGAKTFKRYIDPKHIASQRHWLSARLDVRRFRAQRIDLVIGTAVGPSGSPCADWAVFGDMHFDGRIAQRDHPFSLEYQDPDIGIYRYHDPLPRLAAYARVNPVSSADDALAALTSPTLDPAESVPVESSDPGVTSLANGPMGFPTAGTIDSYDPLRISGSVSVKRPSLVVLNDTWYPGWVAYVDGARTDILHADYLFRGILVPAGTHRIVFSYEPRSFALGFALTIAGLVVALAMLLGAEDGLRRLIRKPPAA